MLGTYGYMSLVFILSVAYYPRCPDIQSKVNYSRGNQYVATSFKETFKGAANVTRPEGFTPRGSSGPVVASVTCRAAAPRVWSLGELFGKPLEPGYFLIYLTLSIM